MKYPCYIEFTQSGRLALLVHKNQRVLARLLVHGPFAEICDAIHRSDTTKEEEFEAEVFGLASYERIDAKQERIVEC